MDSRRKRRHNRTSTRRKKPDSAMFIDIVNDSYHDILRGRSDPSKHLFFENIQWWKETYNIYLNLHYPISKGYKYSPTTDISHISQVDSCSFSPEKTLTESYLKDFFNTLYYKKKNYKSIQKTCHEMTDYALPSTVSSLAHWKKFDSPDAINVVILGAGPVGLFTALYLNESYNKFKRMSEFIQKNINILVIDNRIKEEGIKLPYSRSTQFGFNIVEFQPFLHNIFCWDMDRDDTRAFDYIHVLENLLYTVAFEYKIPMFFTRKFDDSKDLKKFIKDQSIHLLFDCTGGRSKIPIPTEVNMKRWNKYSFKEGNQEVVLNKTTGYYEFCEDGEMYTRPTYRIQIFDKKNKEIMVGNSFAFTTDKSDIELAMKYNNACLCLKDYLLLSSHFKSEQLRGLFPRILESDTLKAKDIKTVKIVVFYSIARHSPFAAAKLNRNCTLLRLGDSLGGTEYGIMFGMKHSIEFSKHICNLISSFI